MARKPAAHKQIDALRHGEATRRNIPTAEMESFFRREEDSAPMPPVHYPRARPLAEGETRTAEEPSAPELIWNGAKITITPEQMAELAETGTLTLSDAQLVWRGKDRQDWSDLVVNVPPLYVQEKIHPRAIIEGLRRYNPPRDGEVAARSADGGGAATSDSLAESPLHHAAARRGPPPRPGEDQPDLFSDFNGIEPDQRAEFYQHDQHWSNRMILGDSLQVMASLAERESMRGKVQCIYFDPPYGIKFNSNWQVSTRSRDVKDGKQTDISREPEQVKAFRDTWKDGIHSYLAYLRDRLTAMRDLLTESGSVFVQIGDENVHRVRAVMDEVFGAENFFSQISFVKAGALGASGLPRRLDYILWFTKNASKAKYRKYIVAKSVDDLGQYTQIVNDDFSLRSLSAEEKANPEEIDQTRLARLVSFTKPGPGARYPLQFEGRSFQPGSRWWGFPEESTKQVIKAGRIRRQGNSVASLRYWQDWAVDEISNVWIDTASGSAMDKIYVVQTNEEVTKRCILMATDPGDLVLDPTCGSGTTAFVAEQWGRRWITVDTSRVALALARTRLMAARYPWYLLADSREGRAREAELSKRVPADTPVHGDIRQGFVYERVPHITLKSIANNPLIDDIWDKWQAVLEPLRAEMNAALIPPRDGEGDHPKDGRGGAATGVSPAESPLHHAASRRGPPPRPGEELQEWQIPREAPADWPEAAKAVLPRWWEARIARQREIDAAIAARADVEYLYDKPYTDASRVRVAGPFTVESLSPHRVVPASEEELIETLDAADGQRSPAAADLAGQDFAAIVIDYLKAEGVKQQEKGDRIAFESIAPWPGNFVGAVATFIEGGKGASTSLSTNGERGDAKPPFALSEVEGHAPKPTERRAAILIGPEYGTVGRQDLVAAAREAVDNRFDVLIACAFNFDAHSSELGRLGGLPILKARINPDMHMSEELKNTGRGNMFVVFGEPDVEIVDDGGAEIRVKVNGVDVFDPNTGDIRSSDTAGIAAWFIDTDFDEESFFVRHAYFLGANDPYEALRKALKAEIDEDAWATLYADTSRPFPRPTGGRIAVKVINHFGDEVMKVFGV